MSDYTTMIPAPGCLKAAWKASDPASPLVVVRHYAVIGVRGEHLVPVIDLNGCPATAADLEAWLTRGADREQFSAVPCGDGRLWQWLPACGCRGESLHLYPVDHAASIMHIDDLGDTPEAWFEPADS